MFASAKPWLNSIRIKINSSRSVLARNIASLASFEILLNGISLTKSEFVRRGSDNRGRSEVQHKNIRRSTGRFGSFRNGYCGNQSATGPVECETGSSVQPPEDHDHLYQDKDHSQDDAHRSQKELGSAELSQRPLSGLRCAWLSGFV